MLGVGEFTRITRQELIEVLKLFRNQKPISALPLADAQQLQLFLDPPFPHPVQLFSIPDWLRSAYELSRPQLELAASNAVVTTSSKRVVETDITNTSEAKKLPRVKKAKKKSAESTTTATTAVEPALPVESTLSAEATPPAAQTKRAKNRMLAAEKRESHKRADADFLSGMRWNRQLENN
jgi:hypothetical protein